MDKADKGLRLMDVLSGNLPQPDILQDPFGALDVLSAFSSALPTFVEATDLERARGTVEKMITVDGLFRAIGGHLGTSLSPEVPKTTRERMSITCLQVLESVFMLFESTVDWYKLGVDAVLKPLTTLVANSAQSVLDTEEQPLIRKVYGWLFPGRDQILDLRPAHLIANQESSLPQYLRNLLMNGPLQNFSTIASCMMPHLKRKERTPDIVWRTLHRLLEVPGLPDADDGVTLRYFCEEHRSKDQLEVEVPELPMLNLQ
ncbi:hypothetical protein BC826DRAFT_1001295 [Russula brevipes]|nr:hypothetical protein BC826DRAFT_1001295 [Russula brevipes]